MASWDFTNTPPITAKSPLSAPQSPHTPTDEVPPTADPVFELDEDRNTGRGRTRDDSEESSSGPPTPGPTTPVLAGLSSPQKTEPTNRVACVSPEDGLKSGPGYNPPPPTTTSIPARVARARSSSRSAPGSPTHLDGASVAVPHSAPPDKTSQGSRFWTKLTKRSSTRGKLNSAFDNTLVRVVSAGFSGKSSKM